MTENNIESLEKLQRLDELGMYLDKKYNVIRCKTCGCPYQICTCIKIKEGKN